MPARRTPLKLKAPLEAAGQLTRDAATAGLGLDWEITPEVLDADGLAEWRRLAEVFASQPVRFREGDRAAVTSYCAWWAAYLVAQRDLRDRGPVVKGRATHDRERWVKNPAAVAAREASTQVRYWCRELLLSPDSRGRGGITEQPDPIEDPNNPFAGGGTW